MAPKLVQGIRNKWLSWTVLFAVTISLLYSCVYYDYQRRIATFRYSLDSSQRQVLQEIVEVLLSIVEKEKIIYFLYAGSLLGSYRHHDIIPWDDDVDIMIPQSQAELLKNAIIKSGDFGILTDLLPAWKIYKVKSYDIVNGFAPFGFFPWKYPFIDVFFYEDEGDMIRDNCPIWVRDNRFYKDDFFPLTKRPFFGRLMNAPRRTKKLLNIMYKLNTCETPDMKHSSEIKSIWQLSEECSRLHKFFPFVHRYETEEGINETLKIDGKVISWWLEPKDIQDT